MGMSTLSPSTYNDSLSWDINSYDSYNGEEYDHEILTALVRTSYLKHLQRSLSSNYEHWLDNNRGNDDFACNIEDIMRCANNLEQKALRACMITSYYQRAMVRTMKDIKHSTEEGSLFSPLIEQMYDNTERKKKTCEKGTQTNVSLISFRVDNESLPEKPASTVDITLENSNLIIINPCNELIKENENNDGLDDLFNILMSSPTFPEKDVKDKFQSSKKRKYNNEHVPYTHSYDEESVNFDHIMTNGDFNTVASTYNEPISLENNYTKAEVSFENSVPKQIQSPFIEHQNPVIKNEISLCKNSEGNLLDRRKSNLDERLQNLAALFGEDSPQPNDSNEPQSSHNEATDASVANEEDESSSSSDEEFSFRLPLDWKTEYAAQSCNLKEILCHLTPAKTYRIQKRFRELFGERTFHTAISSNEEALCRKRTASLVVGELTPYYVAGRIASKEIFKSLAKKITDDILLYSYVAELDEIAGQVNCYFENGRCIYSEKDFSNI